MIERWRFSMRTQTKLCTNYVNMFIIWPINQWTVELTRGCHCDYEISTCICLLLTLKRFDLFFFFFHGKRGQILVCGSLFGGREIFSAISLKTREALLRASLPWIFYYIWSCPFLEIHRERYICRKCSRFGLMSRLHLWFLQILYSTNLHGVRVNDEFVFE